MKNLKSMNKICLLFLSVLFLNSCLPGEKDQIISIENKYSLAIPSYLNEVTNLNEDASLQYQNLLRSFYIIVIDETKNEMQKALVVNDLLGVYTNDINGYSELLLNGFEQSVEIDEKSDIIDTLVNNMPAKLLSIKGRIEGMDVFYSIAFIASETKYYQILAWTVASKEDQYKEKMNQIMYTLKEL